MNNQTENTAKDVKKKIKLTKRQEHFCREYIVNGHNGTQAAIKAGYSKKTANQIATENLAKPYILEFIKSIQKPILEKYQIDTDSIIKDFDSIRNSNVTDYFDVIGDQIVLKAGIKKLSDLPPEVTKNIKSLKTTANGIAVEMYCRDAALRDLAKIAGLFIEKSEVDLKGKIDITINYSKG